MTLEVIFEFTTRFKYGVVLDTKGIRESIEQRAPLKALNSFALMDTFDGVDEPLLAMTARIGFEIGVSAAIVKVSVGGGTTVGATIDFYDPYPDTSEGLVRPFEMISFSTNPFEWFEFTVTLRLDIYFSIEIGIFARFFEITLYEYRETFEKELIEPIYLAPGAPDPIIICNPDSKIMTLIDPGDVMLECTSLQGTLGDETIECIKDIPDNPFVPSCTSVARIETEAGSGVNLVFGGDKRDGKTCDASVFDIVVYLLLLLTE